MTRKPYAGYFAAEGLNALSGLGWDDEALGYFSCVSEDLNVTPGNYSRVGDVPNDVTYMVDSHKEDIVEQVNITLDVFNVSQATPAIREYKRLSLLFERLDLQIPAGLPAAIEAVSPATFSTPYGVVSFKRDEFNLGYGLEVKISDLTPMRSEIGATATTASATPPPASISPHSCGSTNLRAGPGTTYDRVGSVSQSEALEIVGMTAAGDWYRLKSGAWIAAFLVDGMVGTVPVVTAPTPTPTTRPTQTPMPTSTPDIGDDIMAEVMCEEFVKDNLKSPATASFGGWFDDWDTDRFLNNADAEALGINVKSYWSWGLGCLWKGGCPERLWCTDSVGVSLHHGIPEIK